MSVERLSRPDGHEIAFRRLGGSGPGIIFISGFNSAMTGIKASWLAERCRDRGHAFLRFDAFGHGESTGRLAEGTVGRWKEDAVAVLDRLTSGPQILIGSSMGAWIAALVAESRPERIAGLVGVAAAPDFTRELIEPSLSAGARAALARDGVWLRPSAYGAEPYPIARRALEEAARHLVLSRRLAFGFPVRLLHGTADSEVPADLSLRLAGAIDGPDTAVTLVPGGDHRLSGERELALLGRALDQLLAKAASPSR
ncbi:MAG: alpha/beta hydrolase [Alphaproteobacteria bacterium]|nr:alpha/beta hydrolase [Alphaproteobacteria bacterium]